MTITATTSKATFNGNDSATSFPFTFKVLDQSHLVVVHVSSSDVETVKTITTDYTVSLNADQETNPGGTITYPVSGAPLATGDDLIVYRNISAVQTTDMDQQGQPFLQVESALDWLTMITQQQQNELSRSIKSALSDDAGINLTLPAASTRAGKYLSFAVGGGVSMSSGTGADSALRTDLASTESGNGIDLIAKGIKSIESVAELVAENTDTKTVLVQNYHAGINIRPRIYVWDSTADKADHNGGTIIDPDITFPTDWANSSQRVVWFTAGTGTGCWRLKFDEYNVLDFGAKGDGTTDDYQSIKACIDAIPNRIGGGATNLAGGGPWEYANTYNVIFPASSTTYVHSQKIVIPYSKNIILKTPAPAAAALQYTGNSYYGVEFQPGGIAKSVGIINLNIKDGGVAIIGTQGGNIQFEDMYIYNSPSYGMVFIDGPDYTDGPSGDYTTPGSFSATGSGVNTVFVTMKKVQFFYCEKGLGVLSTTVLLFNCYKPRFYGCTNAALTISAVGLIFEEPEFLGVENYTTAPYIHFPCDNSNGTSHIFFNGGRFGSEDITLTQYTPNRPYAAPTSYILFGEYGTYSARSANPTNIVFRDFICEGDNSVPKETDHLVWSSADIRQLRFENCQFTQFQDALINEKAFDDAAVSATECIFRDCIKQATSIGDWFSSGGQGWKRTEERIEFPVSDSPSVALAASHTAGTGATVSMSGQCNDARGSILLTTGTSSSSGNVFTLTFAREFNTAPKMMLIASNLAAAALSLNTTLPSTTTITVRASGLSDSTAYLLDYILVG